MKSIADTKAIRDKIEPQIKYPTKAKSPRR